MVSSTENSFKAPTSNDEYWKYSSVESYLKLPHEAFEGQLPKDLVLSSEIKALISQFPSHLVFYNDVLVDSLSSADVLKTLTAQANTGASKDYFDVQNIKESRSRFKLSFQSKSSIEDLLVLRVFGKANRPSRHSSSLNYEFSKNAVVNLFECNISLDGSEFSVNHLTEFSLDSGAVLNRVKIFNLGQGAYCFDRESISLQNQAQFRNCVINMGGAWTRLESTSQLTGAKCQYDYSGLYLLGQKSKFDLTSGIFHKVPETKSSQIFKGILRDKAHAAFNGRIVIEKDAQKSETAQLNKNIILDDGAEADTRPQLEVYADDVKASHGATIGQLNDQEIFYLRSRAIPKDLAVRMVAQGFAGEIVDLIQGPKLKSVAQKFVDDGFAKIVGQVQQ